MTGTLRVSTNASLRHLNTFGVEAQAALLLELFDLEDLDAAINACEGRPPALILGGGSNLLLTRSIDSAVLRMAASGHRVIDRTGNQVCVEALAGTDWHEFVLWTLSQGLCGLENLALIPGTVGAGPIQNIGAYGMELDQCLAGLTAVDLGIGEQREFTPADCALGYRSSIFKRAGYERWLIIRVRFRLSVDGRPNLGYGELRAELASRQISQPTARDVAEAVIAIRRRKLPDPRHIGNAGSFFKNPSISESKLAELLRDMPDMPHFPGQPQVLPTRIAAAAVGKSEVGAKDGDGTTDPNHAQTAAATTGQSEPVAKIPAAWLIERCGWKGYRDGDAGVYAGHSLILVNHGQATGEQLFELASRIGDSVEQRFGIRLEIEPKVI